MVYACAKAREDDKAASRNMNAGMHADLGVSHVLIIFAKRLLNSFPEI